MCAAGWVGMGEMRFQAAGTGLFLISQLKSSRTLPLFALASPSLKTVDDLCLCKFGSFKAPLLPQAINLLPEVLLFPLVGTMVLTVSPLDLSSQHRDSASVKSHRASHTPYVTSGKSDTPSGPRCPHLRE